MVLCAYIRRQICARNEHATICELHKLGQFPPVGLLGPWHGEHGAHAFSNESIDPFCVIPPRVIGGGEIQPDFQQPHQLAKKNVVKFSPTICQDELRRAFFQQKARHKLGVYFLRRLARDGLQPQHVTEGICDNQNV